MIHGVKGTLIFKDLNGVVIDLGNISFRCYTTLNTLSKIGSVGEKVSLLTHLNVKEDALDLYGFCDSEELNCFRLLLSVSGVGPKAALSILSQLSPKKLTLAIASKDIKAISAANGIGKKIAERVILELKDKLNAVVGEENIDSVSAVESVSEDDSYKDAIDALIALGYARTDAVNALSSLDKELDTEQMIKSALKKLM